MTIEKNMQRLFWRFSGKNFTPNKNDIDALTMVAEWINKCQSETIREQQIFAKLYVRQLRDYLWASGNLKLAIGQMQFILELPLSHYIDMFALDFNILKYRMYCEENNIEWQIPETLTEQERNDIIDYIHTDEKYRKHILGYWTKEKIETSLINELTDTIAKYKNLP